MKENITKAFKQSAERLKKLINFEAKNISKKSDLVGRVECLPKNPAFVTLNEHFQTSLPWLLLIKGLYLHKI